MSFFKLNLIIIHLFSDYSFHVPYEWYQESLYKMMQCTKNLPRNVPWRNLIKCNCRFIEYMFCKHTLKNLKHLRYVLFLRNEMQTSVYMCVDKAQMAFIKCHHICSSLSYCHSRTASMHVCVSYMTKQNIIYETCLQPRMLRSIALWFALF